MRASDLDFVLNSWLKSYRNSKKTKKLTNEQYYPAQTALIFDLLKSAKVLVAADIEDESRIFGYLVYEDPFVVHFAYIKHIYRRFGILKYLMQSAKMHEKNILVTHWLPSCKKLKWKGIRNALT